MPKDKRGKEHAEKDSDRVAKNRSRDVVVAHFAECTAELLHPKMTTN